MDFRMEWHVVDGSKGIVSVEIRGDYPPGSEGNEHGSAISNYVRTVVKDSHARAVLLDFRELRYRFGDVIGAAFVHPRRQVQGKTTFLPCAVAASGRTKKSLVSLLTDFGSIDSFVSLAFFDNREDALAHLQDAVNSQNLPLGGSIG